MTPFDLVLVGKEHSSYHEARSVMIQLGIQSRVHIYNVLDEEKIGYLYQNASLYVLPSLYEGSEQTLLLPLAYNLPIASSILPPVLLNLSQDKITFFRPMSISDMYEAIKKSLNNITSDQKKKKDMSKYEPMKISKEVSALFSQFESKKDASASVPVEEKTNL
jgi:glycosyltransferase involved in cell wall biosynthesis